VWVPRSHRSTSVQPTRRAMMVSSDLCKTENSPRYSAPMRTGIQGVTLDILLCHDGERSWMVRIGRTLQSFPPSKRSGRLSTHSAFQRDGLRPLFFPGTLPKPWGRLSLMATHCKRTHVRVYEAVSVHHAWRTFTLSRSLPPSLWLLRRLRPPARTLAFACPTT
jgi:hypothetical protein